MGENATTNSNSQQPTLKVMRLYKPKLHVGEDFMEHSNMSLAPNSSDLQTLSESFNCFALANVFVLPDSFGNIYLGETFSSYISVVNHLPVDLQNVGLTVKLQTPGVRVDLSDTRFQRTGEKPPLNPMPVLDSSCSLDMVVDHVLGEVGVHTLRVAVTYLDSVTMEQKSLRKFYRFNVLNPLGIVFKHELIKGTSYVEAQIKNDSQAPIFIDSVTFQSLNPFNAIDLNAPADVVQHEEEDNLRELEICPHPILRPDEIMQRTFKFTTDDKSIVFQQGNINLGRLEVSWKTSVGEVGRLQTKPVIRKGAPVKEVQVSVNDISSQISVGSPFIADFTVNNYSNRNLNLQLQLRRELMSGIFCNSLSHQNLGKIQSNCSKTVSIELLPLVAGLHSICGIVVVDVDNALEYVQDKVLDVVVANSIAT